MKFLEIMAEKWNTLRVKMKPTIEKSKEIFAAIDKVLCIIWKYLVRLRKIFAAIPVAWAAIRLAMYNMEKLPESVGLNLQLDGAFSVMITRELAVLGPVAITALCLLLMFCSKRILTPWFVSIFTLVLPIFILVLNMFPA